MAHTCQGGRKTYWVWSSIGYKRGQYPRALKYNSIWRGAMDMTNKNIPTVSNTDVRVQHKGYKALQQK